MSVAEEPVRSLRAELARLRKAAAELVDPIERKVLRDNGIVTIHTQPSLLTQLREAVATGSESRGSVRSSGSVLPISPSAADQLAELVSAAVKLHLAALLHDGLSPEERIRASAEVALRWADPRSVAWVTNQLAEWASQIRDLLDPPRRFHLAAACPRCGVRHVWRLQAGEEVQVPALSVDSRNGAVCLSCGHRWAPTQLAYLNHLLDTPVGPDAEEDTPEDPTEVDSPSG